MFVLRSISSSEVNLWRWDCLANLNNDLSLEIPYLIKFEACLQSAPHGGPGDGGAPYQKA